MGAMKLYADASARRTRQLVADLLFVLWIICWVWFGHVVQHGTMQLAGVGRQTDSSATSLANGLTSAGDTLSGIPLVGGGVSAPFDQMSSASKSLAEAGRAQVTAVHRLSWALGISLAVIPILCVAVFFVPIRWRFVREATASARFIDAAEDLDLFALRALARQPMYVLAKISDDPAGAWRARDPEVVTALARLELRDAGLAVPAHLS
jgi:hypothetical protein